MMDFECGHIKAESVGGDNDINNLLPILVYVINLCILKIWNYM